MSDIKSYRLRRNKRLAERGIRCDADEDGRWVTTENGHHVHFNGEGEPDIGNPKVIAKMKGGRKSAAQLRSAPRKKVDEEWKDKQPKNFTANMFEFYKSAKNRGDEKACRDYLIDMAEGARAGTGEDYNKEDLVLDLLDTQSHIEPEDRDEIKYNWRRNIEHDAYIRDGRR